MRRQQPWRRRVAFALWGRRHREGLRRRLFHALYDMHGWWDWGRAVMALVGRDDCGSYSPPEPRAWYYTPVGGKRIVVAKSYAEFKRIDQQMTAARDVYTAWFRSLSEAERMAEIRRPAAEQRPSPPEPYWHHLNVEDDGHTLIPGNVFIGEGGRNYGLTRRVARLLVRYVVVEWWLKANWLGLRPWLYYRGLNAAVNDRRPFRCHVTPDPGSGGYRHWACGLKRRHHGSHRYHNYTWAGPGAQVVYDPLDREPVAA